MSNSLGSTTIKLDETVKLLLSLTETQHSGIKNKAERVSKTCAQIADAIEDGGVKEQISLAVKLYYSGLVTVSPETMTKKSALLTAKENESLKTANQKAAAALNSISNLKEISNIILHIHDQFNAGSSKDTPLSSRIISVVCKFEQYIHPFNSCMPSSINLASKKLLTESDELDPNIVNVFLNTVLPKNGYPLSEEVTLYLDDLAPQMILSRNVTSESGDTLLVANTTLDYKLIDLLTELAEHENTNILTHLTRSSVTEHNTCDAPSLPTPIISMKPGSNKNVVIVVDDESGIVNTIKWQLKRASYDVIGFTDPYKALKRVASPDVYAVVSDLNMPIMNGDKFLVKIHELAPTVPCIILTGQTTKDNVETLLLANNLTRILAKPWDEKTLLATVNSASMEMQQQVE